MNINKIICVKPLEQGLANRKEQILVIVNHYFKCVLFGFILLSVKIFILKETKREVHERNNCGGRFSGLQNKVKLDFYYVIPHILYNICLTVSEVL